MIGKISILERTTVRIPVDVLREIDNAANRHYCGRSAVITQILRVVVHDLQTRHLRMADVMYLANRHAANGRRSVSYRIERHVRDYLKLNGISVAACLIYHYRDVIEWTV